MQLNHVIILTYSENVVYCAVLNIVYISVISYGYIFLFSLPLLQ